MADGPVHTRRDDIVARNVQHLQTSCLSALDALSKENAVLQSEITRVRSMLDRVTRQKRQLELELLRLKSRSPEQNDGGDSSTRSPRGDGPVSLQPDEYLGSGVPGELQKLGKALEALRYATDTGDVMNPGRQGQLRDLISSALATLRKAEEAALHDQETHTTGQSDTHAADGAEMAETLLRLEQQYRTQVTVLQTAMTNQLQLFTDRMEHEQERHEAVLLERDRLADRVLALERENAQHEAQGRVMVQQMRESVELLEKQIEVEYNRGLAKGRDEGRARAKEDLERREAENSQRQSKVSMEDIAEIVEDAMETYHRGVELGIRDTQELWQEAFHAGLEQARGALEEVEERAYQEGIAEGMRAVREELLQGEELRREADFQRALEQANRDNKAREDAAYQRGFAEGASSIREEGIVAAKEQAEAARQEGYSAGWDAGNAQARKAAEQDLTSDIYQDAFSQGRAHGAADARQAALREGRMAGFAEGLRQGKATCREEMNAELEAALVAGYEKGIAEMRGQLEEYEKRGYQRARTELQANLQQATEAKATARRDPLSPGLAAGRSERSCANSLKDEVERDSIPEPLPPSRADTVSPATHQQGTVPNPAAEGVKVEWGKPKNNASDDEEEFVMREPAPGEESTLPEFLHSSPFRQVLANRSNHSTPETQAEIEALDPCALQMKLAAAERERDGLALTVAQLQGFIDNNPSLRDLEDRLHLEKSRVQALTEEVDTLRSLALLHADASAEQAKPSSYEPEAPLGNPVQPVNTVDAETTAHLPTEPEITLQRKVAFLEQSLRGPNAEEQGTVNTRLLTGFSERERLLLSEYEGNLRQLLATEFLLSMQNTTVGASALPTTDTSEMEPLPGFAALEARLVHLVNLQSALMSAEADLQQTKDYAESHLSCELPTMAENSPPPARQLETHAQRIAALTEELEALRRMKLPSATPAVPVVSDSRTQQTQTELSSSSRQTMTEVVEPRPQEASPCVETSPVPVRQQTTLVDEALQAHKVAAQKYEIEALRALANVRPMRPVPAQQAELSPRGRGDPGSPLTAVSRRIQTDLQTPVEHVCVGTDLVVRDMSAQSEETLRDREAEIVASQEVAQRAADLEASLHQADAERAHLHAQSTELAQTCANLSVALHAKEELCSEQQQQLERAAGMISDLQESLQNTERQLRDLHERSCRTEAENDFGQAEVSELRQDVAQLTAQISDLKTANQKLEAKQLAEMQRAAVMDEEVETLRALAVLQQPEATDVLEARKRRDEQYQQIQANLSRAEAQLEDAKNENARGNQELASAKTRVAELERELQKELAQASELERQLHAAQDDLKAVQTEREEDRIAAAEAEKKLDELIKDLAVARTELRGTGERSERSEMDHGAALAKLAELEQHSAAVTQQLQKLLRLQSELQSLEDAFRIAASSTAETAQLNASQNKLELVLQEQEAPLTLEQESISRLRAALAEIAERQEIAERDYVQLRRALEAQNEDKKQLRATLAATERRLQHAAAAGNKTETSQARRLAALSTEVDTLRSLTDLRNLSPHREAQATQTFPAVSHNVVQTNSPQLRHTGVDCPILGQSEKGTQPDSPGLDSERLRENLQREAEAELRTPRADVTGHEGGLTSVTARVEQDRELLRVAEHVVVLERQLLAAEEKLNEALRTKSLEDRDSAKDVSDQKAAQRAEVQQKLDAANEKIADYHSKELELQNRELEREKKLQQAAQRALILQHQLSAAEDQLCAARQEAQEKAVELDQCKQNVTAMMQTVELDMVRRIKETAEQQRRLTEAEALLRATELDLRRNELESAIQEARSNATLTEERLKQTLDALKAAETMLHQVQIDDNVQQRLSRTAELQARLQLVESDLLLAVQHAAEQEAQIAAREEALVLFGQEAEHHQLAYEEQQRTIDSIKQALDTQQAARQLELGQVEVLQERLQGAEIARDQAVDSVQQHAEKTGSTQAELDAARAAVAEQKKHVEVLTAEVVALRALTVFRQPERDTTESVVQTVHSPVQEGVTQTDAPPRTADSATEILLKLTETLTQTTVTSAEMVTQDADLVMAREQLQTIPQLQNQLQLSESLLQQSRNEASERDETLNVLRTQLTDAIEANNKTSHLLEEEKASSTSLRNQLEKLTDKHVELSTECNDLRLRWADAELALANVSCLHVQLENIISNQQALQQEDEALHDCLGNQVETLEVEIAKLAYDLSRCQGKLDVSAAVSKHHEDSAEHTQHQLTEEQQKNIKLSEALQVSERQQEEISRQLADTVEEKNRAIAEATKARSEAQALLQKQASETAISESQHAVQITELTEEVNALRALTEQALANAAAEADQLRQVVDTTCHELASQRALAQEIQSELEVTRHALNEERRGAEALRERLERAEVEGVKRHEMPVSHSDDGALGDLRAEVDELRNSLNRVERENERLRAQTQALERQLATETEQLENAGRQLRRNEEAHTQALTELAGQLQELRAQNKRLERLAEGRTVDELDTETEARFFNRGTQQPGVRCVAVQAGLAESRAGRSVTIEAPAGRSRSLSASPRTERKPEFTRVASPRQLAD
eukprot:TRINITY_DN8834_c0_g1_i6.p1 TRINITY_DN8834_c0_g1~~TRINITY_DN8834_c0_g1_i6.p1  ORF type:complete len:2561 (-),score=528.59 TRINITY_DN8834_c0_g1_i6:5-7687(-)